MAVQSIQEQLDSLKNAWTKTKPREVSSFQSVPDGEYLGKCQVARLENSKNSGRLQVAWQFKVLKGEQKNRVIFFYSGMDSEDALSWLKAIFVSLEIELPKNIVNLPKRLGTCLNKEALLTVKSNGQYTNVYVNPVTKKGNGKDMDEDAEDELDEL